ncbi:MAG: glycosyltransferase family 4 protein [Gemmatimonadaceae bacterium]
MRVMLVTGSFPPMKCGVGDYSFNVVRALARDSSMQVAVLTSRAADVRKAPAGVDLFPIIDRWSIHEAKTAIGVIRRWNPDIVHVQFPTQGYGTGKLPWFLPLLAFTMGRRVVQTWHGGHGSGFRDLVKLSLKIFVPGRVVVVYRQFEDTFHPRLHALVRWKRPVFIANAPSIPGIVLSKGEREAVRARFATTKRRLVVFVGFVFPYKGVELLFDIANPATDQVVIAGEIGSMEYLATLEARASSDRWNGHATIAGSMTLEELASLLQVADAVVLPFRDGGGDWNTSLLGAIANGAFVVATSRNESGYDARRNVYFARVDDVDEMRRAVDTHSGTRRGFDAEIDSDAWQRVANDHEALYLGMMNA